MQKWLQTPLAKLALVLSATALVGGYSTNKTLCAGFLPENDLKISSVGTRSGGLSEIEFNAVLDRVEKYYTPIVQAKGGVYSVNREWTNDTVNASANRSGNTWFINMYGGLARYPTMDQDGYLLVACHETGHQLGGSPKFQGWFGGSDWAANEGEADYYATLRCMRFIFANDDNAGFVQDHVIDATLRQSCVTAYPDVNAQNICMRAGQAAMTVSKIFHDLKKDQNNPDFATPDTHAVQFTDDNHPATQCRLDTYYQSSLCVHDTSVELSDSDYHVGTCTDTTKPGVRPRCWFQPDEQALPSSHQASN